MHHRLSDGDVLSPDPSSPLGPPAALVPSLTVMPSADCLVPASPSSRSSQSKRQAPKVKIPAPLLQGELDGLCGVYALINAVRLLLGKPSRSMASALFHLLLDAIDADHGLTHIIHDGIAFDAELKLARAAVNFIGSQYRSQLVVRPLIDTRKRPPLAMVMVQVAQVIDAGGVVVAAFMGRLNHWSVIRQVTPLHLGLHDSSRLTRVRVDRCRMSYEPCRTTGDHVIDLKGLFALTRRS